MSKQQTKDEAGKKRQRKILLWVFTVLAFVLLVSPIVIWESLDFYMKSSDFIKFYSQHILQLVIGAVGIFFVHSQIRAMAKNTQDADTWNRRTKSLEFTANRTILTTSFDVLVKYMRNHNGVSLAQTLESLDRSKEQDQEFENNIKIIANYFEEMAVGIKHEVYDDGIMYECMRKMLLRFCEDFGCYLLRMRGKGELDNERAWIGLENLAEEWKARYDSEMKSSSGTSQA